MQSHTTNNSAVATLTFIFKIYNWLFITDICSTKQETTKKLKAPKMFINELMNSSLNIKQ